MTCQKRSKNSPKGKTPNFIASSCKNSIKTKNGISFKSTRVTMSNGDVHWRWIKVSSKEESSEDSDEDSTDDEKEDSGEEYFVVNPPTEAFRKLSPEEFEEIDFDNLSKDSTINGPCKLNLNSSILDVDVLGIWKDGYVYTFGEDNSGEDNYFWTTIKNKKFFTCKEQTPPLLSATQRLNMFRQNIREQNKKDTAEKDKEAIKEVIQSVPSSKGNSDKGPYYDNTGISSDSGDSDSWDSNHESDDSDSGSDDDFVTLKHINSRRTTTYKLNGKKNHDLKQIARIHHIKGHSGLKKKDLKRLLKKQSSY